MARLYIKSKTQEPFFIENEVARKISKAKSDFESGNAKDVWVETLQWSGNLSKISSIEFDVERKYTNSLPVEKPMTEAELKSSKESMARVRANLEKQGILKPKRNDGNDQVL